MAVKEVYSRKADSSIDPALYDGNRATDQGDTTGSFLPK